MQQAAGAMNLPNAITIARIVAIAAIAALMLVGQQGAPLWWALGIYAVAAVSDYLDGWLARAWNQQSAFGRMLDPIADKLLVGAVLLLLVNHAVITGAAMVPALVILMREILVSGLREFLASLAVEVHVTQLAKWKTAAQLIALGLLLASAALGPADGMVQETGIALLWASAALTGYTGYAYLRAALAQTSAINPRLPSR